MTPRRLICLLTTLGITSIARADDLKPLVMWDTVSPDSKYALAWTKAELVAFDDMPDPDDKEGGVRNWLIDLDSRQQLLPIPDVYFWIRNQYRRSHYDLETAWSDDSSRLLVVLNSRWETVSIVLVSPKSSQAREIVKPVLSAFKQVLQRKGDADYKKQPENYALSFGNPWFVASEKFEIVAAAVIPKSEESDYLVYKLTFGFSGDALSLEKVTVLETSNESSDRQLNRIYRSLIPILDPAEREALRKEERAWIVQRDSASGSEAKEKSVQDRVGELSSRRERRIGELEKEQGNGTTEGGQ